MSDNPDSGENNRLSKRIGRYAKVGANVGGVAARYAGKRMLGIKPDDNNTAAELASILGNLKGPLMKVAQLLSTIPDLVPPEYAEELSKLQNQAPPMGWAFVKRRMAAELGPDWQSRFSSFEKSSAASASLGQVHKAVSLDGAPMACKLQYPDMSSAVEADLTQLSMALSVYKRLDKSLDTSEILPEISERLREELDYIREAAHTKLYGDIFRQEETIRVPEVHENLTTQRLLTLQWLEGRPLSSYVNDPEENRNTIAVAMFKAWWHPFHHYGVIHGDPHLGNYTIFENEDKRPGGINLLDYGCIRTFRPKFIQGVIDLYKGLQNNDRDRIVHAYETWGFNNLSDDLIEILNIWARFIHEPLLDDRERHITEGISPAEYGRKEAFAVHKGLREKGPVKVPREFIFMDRAAIGLGSVFIHLNAKLNYYRLFNETIENFDVETVSARQQDLFTRSNVPLPQ